MRAKLYQKFNDTLQLWEAGDASDDDVLAAAMVISDYAEEAGDKEWSRRYTSPVFWIERDLEHDVYRLGQDLLDHGEMSKKNLKLADRRAKLLRKTQEVTGDKLSSTLVLEGVERLRGLETVKSIEAFDVDDAATSYLDAGLWTSTTDQQDPLDALDDLVIEFETQQAIDQHVAAFIVLAAPFATVDNIPANLLGHNLLLSENGHGTGFWDRGWEHGDLLHDIAALGGSSWMAGWRPDDPSGDFDTEYAPLDDDEERVLLYEGGWGEQPTAEHYIGKGLMKEDTDKNPVRRSELKRRLMR